MASLCEEKDGETQCHVHPRYIWLLMMGPVLVLLLILLVVNFAYAYPDAQRIIPWPFAFDIMLLDIILVIIILGSSYIWICLSYRNFVYIIKKDELAIRKGIILKRNNSIPYDKIRNVQRLQSLLERIFGLCTISIETSSTSLEFPDSVIPGIRNSRELPEIILKKMHATQDEEMDLGTTMRQILSQLKDLNKRDQRQEDRQPSKPNGILPEARSAAFEHSSKSEGLGWLDRLRNKH